MDNIKSLPSHIRKGGCVAMYTTCGLGLILLPDNEYLKKIIPDLLINFGNREECLLIGSKTTLNCYLDTIPDMAMTILEMSEKALTLQFDVWNTTEGLINFFPSEISLRIVVNIDESYIINGVGQPLLFIPISQKELSKCKSLSGEHFLFEIAHQESPQRIIEKPGIIKFFSNGTMKIIRE